MIFQSVVVSLSVKYMELIVYFLEHLGKFCDLAKIGLKKKIFKPKLSMVKEMDACK